MKYDEIVMKHNGMQWNTMKYNEIQWNSNEIVMKYNEI